MNKKIFIAFVFLLFATILSADTIKNLNLSKSFSSIPGTPRAVRNGFDHDWLVAWRQQGASAKIVGRIVDSDGSAKASKTLARGVSGASNNFDVFYDSTAYTFLLAFETAKGLQVQLFTGALAKKGTATLIEGVTDTMPRLSYDPVAKHFLIFWLSTLDGTSHKVLKSQVLDESAKPVGSAHVLSQAAAGKTFGSLNVSTNQKNGSLIVIAALSDGTSSSLLGFAVKPDGTLLRAKATTFQSTTNGFFAEADASFSDAGTGFGLWFDRGAIKFRKMSAKLKFSSTAQSIGNASIASDPETGILFDSRNNQFIGAWSSSNTIQAVVLSPTGSISKNPFAVFTGASGDAFSDVATSYDAQLGNAIVVWETLSASKFKVQASIFAVGGAATAQGISIGDDFYSPNTLTINVGDTVTWTNNGNNHHTITSGNGTPDGLFDSGETTNGQTFSFRFTVAGTYHFFCQVHGANVMNGTITVNDNGEPYPHY